MAVRKEHLIELLDALMSAANRIPPGSELEKILGTRGTPFTMIVPLTREIYEHVGSVIGEFRKEAAGELEG